ncbi:MAG: GNAT family N-acetyltransferase [Planctomycetota bacterium]|nr:GNAT family N-acetyltransferase [Planctomycetota bacterium]
MLSTYPRNRKEAEELATLVARCFLNRYDYLRERFLDDYSACPGARPEYWRIIRRKGRVVAHVGVYDKPVRVGRAVLRMGGLGFVCCDPAHRRQGLAAACVKDALAVMRRSGMPLSLLFGRDHYYDRFGYVGCLPTFTLTVNVSELRRVRSPLRVEPYARRHLGAIVKLYNAAAAATPASVVRTAAHMRFGIVSRQLAGDASGKDNAVFLFREKGPRGAVRAYAVWKEKSLWETAMQPGDDAACSAVLAWLRDKRIEALEKEVVLQGLAPAHPLWIHAQRFNHKAERALNWAGGAMGCIVDVAMFLGAMQPEFESRLRAAGVDDEARLDLVVAGRAHKLVFRASRQQGAPRPLTARVTCTPPALLQMTLGTLPYDSIPRVKTVGSPALLRALFPSGAPAVYRLDAF